MTPRFNEHKMADLDPAFVWTYLIARTIILAGWGFIIMHFVIKYW